MPNTEEKKSKNPVVTQSFYSSEINDEVFDNVEFDKKSIELMAKGEDFARIHQTGQRFAVVGWILKDKFQNEEKKRTLHLRLLPGFGPPTPSPENIKKVKNFYGENNIVIAKAAATSGQVHTELIDKANQENPSLIKKYKVITGFSLELSSKGTWSFVNRSMQNFRSFSPDELALACFEFNPEDQLQGITLDDHTNAYHLTRAIPKNIVSKITDSIWKKVYRVIGVSDEDCYNFPFEKKWKEINSLKETERKEVMSQMIMRNIYVNASLNQSSPLFKTSFQRIKHLLEIAEKYHIPIKLHTMTSKTTPNQSTPLITAISRGNTKVAEILIEQLKQEIIINTRNNINPIGQEQKEDDIQKIINADMKQCLDFTDIEGNNALIAALCSGNVKIIDKLIEHGATLNTNDNDLIGLLKQDFLSHLKKGELHVLKKWKECLPKELFKTIFNRKEIALKNAIIQAEKNNLLEFSTWLLDEIIEKNDKYTHDQLEVLIMLSNINKDGNKLKKYIDSKPHLIFAEHPILGVSIENKIFEAVYKTSCDSKEFNELLCILSNSEKYPSIKFKKMINDFLLMAVKNSQPIIVKMLLAFGADRLAEDEKKQTPLIIAAQKGDINLQLLLLSSASEDSKPLNTLNIDIPSEFYKLKPYRQFNTDAVSEDVKQLYENNHSSPQLVYIMHILSEKICDIKDLSFYFMAILANGMTNEIKKELLSKGIEKIDAIEKNIDTFLDILLEINYKNRQIEQKNNQIEIKNKQIEQLKICIKEEKKPSYNPKTKLLEQYTVILKEAVKNKSKWLPLLQKGIIDLNELNNTNLENAREILSKMINKIESHSFLKNRSRSKSLSHLKTILDSIDNQHIVNWQNYTKKLSDYEKEIQILKYEIQDLSDQVVTIKPHDQKANNELSISKNMNSFFLKNAKQISLSSPEPLPLSPRKNSSNS